jgi:hypothetical protein
MVGAATTNRGGKERERRRVVLLDGASRGLMGTRSPSLPRAGSGQRPVLQVLPNAHLTGVRGGRTRREVCCKPSSALR